MGIQRNVDYYFRVAKDDVSPKFRTLEKEEERFHRQSGRGWDQNEKRGKQAFSGLSRHARGEFNQMEVAAAAMESQLKRVLSAAVIYAGLKKSITDLAALGHQMTAIAIKLNQPVESLEEVRQEIIAFSQLSGITDSAENIAKAINTLVGADFSLAESLKIAKAAAKGAAAAQTDTATVVRGLTSILKGFKKEAGESEQILSKMIRAADLGVVELEDLSNALVELVSPSLQAHASIEQVLGILETLSVSGVANAAEASTAIARMLERFSQPDFRKKAIRFGIHVTDEKGNLKSPIEILEMISQRYHSLDNDIKKGKFIEKITGGEIRAKRALIPLLENLDKVKKTINEIEGSGNRLGEAFAESQKDLWGKLESLKNIMKNAGMAFAESLVPTIDRLTKLLQDAFPEKRGGLSGAIREGMERWSSKSMAELALEGVVKNPIFLFPSLVARGILDERQRAIDEQTPWREMQPDWHEIKKPSPTATPPTVLEPKIIINNRIDAATGKTRTDVEVTDPSKWERRTPLGP